MITLYENFDNSENSINGTLKLFSEADIKTVFMTLETSLGGIKNEEAISRLEKFGLNEISKEKVKPWYIQLLLAFLNTFNFILGTLAFVSLLMMLFLLKRLSVPGYL